MFVREWLAHQIIEGLTTHLYEHLVIKAHLFVLLLKMTGMCVHFVCYICVLMFHVHQKILRISAFLHIFL